MADNVPITAGAGTNVATDDVGSAHYQKIKIDAGGDGVSVPIVAGQQTKAASLPVVLASDQDALAVTLTASDALLLVVTVSGAGACSTT